MTQNAYGCCFNKNKFDGILDDSEYDYVVVGSGCTALAFIQEALTINPHARILCLERGGL